MAAGQTEVKTSQTAAQAPAGAAPGGQIPRLAEGVELVGEFEDSGFKEAPFIARRSDGQVVQMPPMLFQLAEQVDGHSNVEQIAERFSHAIERNVTAADAQMLIDEQLRPLGIIAAPTGQQAPELSKVDPLLALKFRAALIPDHAVRALTTLFAPLFFAPVFLAAVLAFIGLDAWLFLVHGVSQSLRNVLYDPALMLMLIGGVVLATAFHEIGHASACRYGGAKPGVMGVGIYIVWPAFYTDITDAYRLGKWGRLRTDVGGMYFNAIFALVVGGIYALTSYEPLLLLIVLQTFAIFQQALPFLRLDGYYILSDLTGVPDIYLRIRAVLSSLLPGREPDPRVAELRNWVRVVVTVYVVAMLGFILVAAVALVINLPRVLATGYDSSALHYQAIGPDFRAGQTVKGVLDVIEMLFLILPAAGLVFTGLRIGRRALTGATRWSAGHAGRQAALALGGAAVVALAAFSWWPNGEYQPIQPGERGTLQGLFGQVAAIPSGRPSLTAKRQRQLGGAPTVRQRQAGSAPAIHSGSPAPTPTRTTSTTTTSAGSTTPTTTTTTSSTTTTPAPATTNAATTTTTTTTTATSPAAAPTSTSSTTTSGGG